MDANYRVKMSVIALFFGSIFSLSAAHSGVPNALKASEFRNVGSNGTHYSLVSEANPPESCVGFFHVKVPTLEDGLFEISECLRGLKNNTISYEKASNTIDYIFKNTSVNHVNVTESRERLNFIISEICETDIYGRKIFKGDVLSVIRFVQGSNLWGEESIEVIKNLKILTKINLYSMECLTAFEELGN